LRRAVPLIYGRSARPARSAAGRKETRIVKIGQFIGWVLLFAALAAIGYEIDAAIHQGGWRPIPLGELWSRIDRGSLDATRAFVQRDIAAWVWQPGIASVLKLPGWLVFGGPAVLLLRLCRERRPRRRFRFR
jgi:hypothetical protein